MACTFDADLDHSQESASLTSPLETYLRELYVIRSSGGSVKETSYYPVLSNLLNEIGKTLKPRVRCIINIQNSGAGLPDGGFFTAEQFRKQSSGELREGQPPARGCIEVKSTGEDVKDVARSEQLMRYVNRYRQALVTNYRDFVLVGVDHEGKVTNRESFSLAPNEKEFWLAASHPHATAQQQGERFVEYLKRVMLHAAPLALPKDVAWFLASYARDAKARIETSDLPALAAVRAALEEALGLKFEGEKGEHFFRSTLVQTLFYGVFSAWVLWSKKHPPIERGARFNWHEAAWSLHVPMIKALFEQVATPSKLEPLGLTEVLDWTAAVLNRVDRKAFFENFEEGHAVQYFYEPFLEAFDPELRKELGVWYTPTEVVQYMVARVDTVLRKELEIADGLADPRVYVLDPCCGTGAYLVEVLRRISTTLKEKGEDALTGHAVKRAAMERVFGFEILPAPFVVSHLQLGLLLQNIGAPFSETTSERAGVYLTNALTGWEPPSDEVKKRLQQLAFSFAELKSEHDAAERVKRESPILVILGNPPYNGFAGVAVEEERDLTNAYRTTIKAPAPQGQGLNDLYVRFYRMAERKIVEQTHKGVVCFISNYSWLDGLSFPGMRERYLEAFDNIWIDSLNGDKYKTGKLTPDGKPDPSIFSTEWNREGIQVGTAIALLVRKEKHLAPDAVQFRNLWGKEKRLELSANARGEQETTYAEIQPIIELGLPYAPSITNAEYTKWPLLPGLIPVSFPGVKTSRDDFVVDIDRDRLLERMRKYFDPQISHEEMRRMAPTVMEDTARFKAENVRDALRKRGFLSGNVVRYCYRPFDIRWLYWEPETKLLDEKRTEYFPNVFEGNVWISAGQRNRKEDFYQPQFTTLLADHHIVESNVGMFPLYLRPESSLLNTGAHVPNLSEAASTYLGHMGSNVDELFFHALATLHAPQYRCENGGALRQDWPRMPLPSAELGRKVAALLDSERGVAGVTEGKIEEPIRSIGVISRVGGGTLRTDGDNNELSITAGWGHGGKGGITMPGKGKLIERDYTPEERKAIVGAGLVPARSQRNSGGDEPRPYNPFECLGEKTCDVYLNDVAYWKNIPARVWDYTIGGYQVIKKWLSYREHKLLGRPLTMDEAHEVMNIARRIASILLLEPSLDANYQTIKTATYPWPSS
ncbi:MAG: type ISP restriction/modification enzyme [Pyrinomonadaceae bacterium]